MWRQDQGNDANFVFSENGVVFCGINLVGGNTNDDQAEWDARLDANLNWIDSNVQFYLRNNMQVFVLFCHSSPALQSNSRFFTTLFERIEQDYSDTYFIIVHRNLVNEQQGLYDSYNSIPNLSVIVVRGSFWPPMRIQVEIDIGNAFTISANQDTWLDEATAIGQQ